MATSSVVDGSNCRQSGHAAQGVLLAGKLPSSRLLTPGEVCRLAALSPQTLRNRANLDPDHPDYLPCVRTKAGHRGDRRFYWRDVAERLLGMDLEELQGSSCSGDGMTSKIWVYLRVSSSQQKRAGSLDNQRTMVLEEVCRREQCHPEDIHLVEEVRSAFSGREEFNRMVVEGIVQGRAKKIYYSYPSRLSRVGCLTRLVEYLADQFGVELVPLWKDENGQSEQDKAFDWQEVLDYIQVVVNTQNGIRAGRVTSRTLDEMTVEFAKRLFDSGHPIETILRELERCGFKTQQGQKISRHVLYKYILNGAGQVMDAVLPKSETKPNSWEEYRRGCLIVGDSSWRLPKKKLMDHYRQFCEERNLLPLSARTVGDLTKDIERKYTHSGHVALCGVKIKKGEK